MQYYTEDKFDAIIKALDERGYSRNLNEERISESDIIWTNLRQLDFEKIEPKTLLNHLQGSQHFSNKVSDESCSLLFCVSSIPCRLIWLIISLHQSVFIIVQLLGVLPTNLSQTCT
jgi:hypothetical protein